ncbi:glycine--tRNA ligase subunit beta [Virgibacillus ainsalahensis]
MTTDVLFEIGLEELPARFIDDAEKQLAEKTKSWLDELRITYDGITSFSTPRRLAVQIENIAEEQTTIEEEAKGPAEKIAKDTDGNWSKAALGFTKGQGKSVEDIYTKEIKGTSYIFVKKHIEGKQTIDLLPGFKEIVESIQFGKNMRWAEETLRYGRPIRWLVALYGGKVVPFAVAHVETGNRTFGHRFLGEEITLEKAEDYPSVLKDSFVIADAKEREHLIVEGIRELEEREDFQIPADEELLNEVKNLVEYPTVFAGSFEQKFLQLPPEVLITSMKEHQRYFPVKSNDGKLLPRFIGVRNGDSYKLDIVTKGNEKVLRARLADAQFFYEEDQKHSIDYYQERLERVVFQEKLGTISDKEKRVVEFTTKLAQLLQLDDKTTSAAVRAAEISKFDLMTNMVNEFTELQGLIGEKYALNFGEDQAVAQSVREHYLPKHANDELPESTAGSIVSIADKLDTIVGCISAGLIPTGSQDPYGLRRQATGVLRIMKVNKWDVSIESLLGIAKDIYLSVDIGQQDNGETNQELHEFFKQRTAYLLKEIGIEQDVTQAVLHNEIGVIYHTFAKAKVLSGKRSDDQFKNIQEALVRVLNLSTETVKPKIDSAHFETDSEQNLYEKYLQVAKAYKKADNENDASKAMEILGELAAYIHDFFEHNMVMAENEEVRNNRLGLVNLVAELINDYADLRTIEWKQQNF